jgi:hypothetical protein
MLNKILFVIILGAFSSLASVEAQTAPAAPAKVQGRIIAARVEGHVEAIPNAGGPTKVLHDGDVITDGNTVVTSPGANVILVFSNGATLNVAADSSLNIEQFIQDPFASDLKVSDMKEEPGTSTTKLSLTKGELVGKVVHLNVDKGSEFTVQTPVGAAGIRGTTFRIVFRPGPNGTTLFSVLTSEGRVVLSGVSSTPVSIPAGNKVVVSFDITGNVASTPVVLTAATGTELTQIQVATQAIVTAVTNTVITNSSGGGGGGGGNGGGNNNNNAPPPPAPAPPATTSGAGSG